MLTTIIVAVILGAFAGAAPGPYTTMVIGTSLQRGFKEGFKLALVPLVTDIIPLVLTVVILDALNFTALTLLFGFFPQWLLNGAYDLAARFTFFR